MGRWKLLYFIVFIGLLVQSNGLSACRPLAPGGAIETTSADMRGIKDAVHTLVAVQGHLSVKREGWDQYAPALFGMVFRQGDLLRLEGNSQATLVCADLTLATVPSGIGGVPCKVTRPVLRYAGSLVNPTRADVSEDIPMVISPRKTKLLNPHPILRWTPVAGASVYTVRVQGPDLDWSTEVIGATEIMYPDDAPPLLAGSTYKVTVVAGERSSAEVSEPGLGFTLLTNEEAKSVRDEEARIRALGLADTPTRFLLATLYRAWELNAEAIEQLELLAENTREPAVWRSLGDLYLKTGVNSLAEERYIQALLLSQEANDTEGQAWVQKALGLLSEARGNLQEAQEHLEKAQRLYEALGDSASVREIQERVTQLSTP